MGGYVDTLACTCQHFGAMVRWSVGAALGVLLLRRIAGVIFAALRGRWCIGASARWHAGARTCVGVHVHWRGEVAGGESTPVRRQK